MVQQRQARPRGERAACGTPFEDDASTRSGMTAPGAKLLPYDRYVFEFDVSHKMFVWILDRKTRQKNSTISI
jgi:hypothetical protein